MQTTKPCSRCKQEKPIASFGIDGRRNQPKAICKPCDSEIHRLRYLDPEKQPAPEQIRRKLNDALARFAEKKASGKCYSCEAESIPGTCYCAQHAAIRAAKERERRAATVRVCPDCGETNLTVGRKKCSTCADPKGKAWSRKQKTWRLKERLFAMQMYGGAHCACCGETILAFLTIDHVNNDGADHRRELAKGVHFIAWLKKHNYPAGFQVLCCNCNRGRWINGGICPHKQLAAQ